jgi:hypothetical protein
MPPQPNPPTTFLLGKKKESKNEVRFDSTKVKKAATKLLKILRRLKLTFPLDEITPLEERSDRLDNESLLKNYHKDHRTPQRFNCTQTKSQKTLHRYNQIAHKQSPKKHHI